MRTTVGVAAFERFFRQAAGLDVDKADIERSRRFVERKLHDLLLVAQASAKANGRDIIEPADLPVTKGLQERVHDYRRLEERADLQPAMQEAARRHPAELVCSEETEARLADVAGGINVALARSFTVLDPGLKNPQTEHWQRAHRLFDLLL